MRTRSFTALGLTLLSSAACGGTVQGDLATDRAPGAGGATASGGAGSAGAPGIFLPTSDASVPVTPPSFTCTAGSLGPDVGSAFDPYVVSHDRVGRRTLYSWTTADQIAELRADPTLLTRSVGTNGQAGRATDYLQTLAATDEIATLLSGPAFEKKRFGWSNAWATALGWAGETYGDQLLEIRLRPEAWVGRLTTMAGAEWAFFDVNDNPVSLEDVKAHPERIGAIYFADVSRGVNACSGTYTPSVFREYVLCNERMIEEWSWSSPEIRQHVADAIAALGRFESATQSATCTGVPSVRCFIEEVVGTWEAPPAALFGRYEASLALPNDLYIPTAENVGALITQLQQVTFDQAPLRHVYGGDAAP